MFNLFIKKNKTSRSISDLSAREKKKMLKKAVSEAEESQTRLLRKFGFLPAHN